jgi:hypothetical protein
MIKVSQGLDQRDNCKRAQNRETDTILQAVKRINHCLFPLHTKEAYL